MSEVTVNKRHVSLPWAAAASVLMAVVSGTGVYFTLKGDVSAAAQVGHAATIYVERVERDSGVRFLQAERRIEKLEETGGRTLLLLERIDERTSEMKRRMDLNK